MKKGYKLFVLFIVILVCIYLFLSASCNNKITFTPERAVSFLLSPFVEKAQAFVPLTKGANYYTYDYKDFKTKEEAKSFCIYSKLGF